MTKEERKQQKNLLKKIKLAQRNGNKSLWLENVTPEEIKFLKGRYFVRYKKGDKSCKVIFN